MVNALNIKFEKNRYRFNTNLNDLFYAATRF
jgi:hypothetical protein